MTRKIAEKASHQDWWWWLLFSVSQGIQGLALIYESLLLSLSQFVFIMNSSLISFLLNMVNVDKIDKRNQNDKSQKTTTD